MTALSGLFVVSSLPYIVYNMLTALYGYQNTSFKKVAGFIYYINLVGDPIVYTMTNKRFCRHCKRLLMSIVLPKRLQSLRVQSNQSYTYSTRMSARFMQSADAVTVNDLVTKVL